MSYKNPCCLPSAVLLSCAVLTACDPPPEPPPATLAITGVTLIDPAREGAREQMTVLVDGEKISAVGPAADLEPPAGIPVVDGTGRFLIPGLWDMHVHLAHEEEPAIPPERQLPLYLAHGVVGVRDMGSEWARIEALRARLATGELRGPEIVSPGPFVDGPQPAGPVVVPVAGDQEAREAVRALVQQGVDFIKVQANLPREAYLAAVDEATTLGKEVHGHVPDAMTVPEVSAAGQRTVEHVSPALPSDGAIFFSCSAREDELRRELADIAAARAAEGADRQQLAERTRALQRALVESYDEAKAAELFAALATGGTRVVPTLIWSRTYSPPTAELPADLPSDVLPEATRERWQGIWEGYFARATPENLALNRTVADGSTAMVRALKDAGVGVLAGTDSPFGFVLPGFSLHQELELLVAAGFTPGEALAAATRDAADFLGRASEAGTVEAGKRADLVLLDADPLADVSNSRKIHAVIAGGTLYTRADLDAMIAEVVEAGRAAPAP